jgi:hypothetical protein
MPSSTGVRAAVAVLVVLCTGCAARQPSPPAAIATTGPTSGHTAARVVFDPSFHTRVCVTAYAEPAPRVVLVVPTEHGYARAFGDWYRQGPYPADLREPPPGDGRWEESAAVPPDRWAAFLAELGAVDPLTLRDEKVSNVEDGMGLGCVYRDAAGRTNAFASRVDGRYAPHDRFGLAVYRLACDVLCRRTSVIALDGLRLYLDDGPPGPPLTLVFSGIWGPDRDPWLRESLARMPGKPVLVDMADVEEMSTLLYPTFRKFAGRPAPTAWVYGHVSVRDHLRAIGVAEDRMFTSREAADAALRR